MLMDVDLHPILAQLLLQILVQTHALPSGQGESVAN